MTGKDPQARRRGSTRTLGSFSIARFWLGPLTISILTIFQFGWTEAQEVGESWLHLPTVDLSGLESAVAEQLVGLADRAQSEIDNESTPLDALAEAVGDLGRHYHAYGLNDGAESCYRVARRLTPQDFRWPYFLGYLLQTDGRLEEAETAYLAALGLYRQAPPALVRLAEVYEALGRTGEAEALLLEALDLDPSSAASQAGLGELYLSAGETNRAIELLESALAAVPEANRLYYPLALAYRNNGDPQKARDLMARRGTVGIRPNDPLIDQLDRLRTGERAYLLAGQRAFRAGRYEDAVSAYQMAVAAEPESVAARIGLGSSLGETGRYSDALEQYERAITIAPDNSTALFNAGRLLTLTGEAPRAIDYLTRAAALAPQDVDVRLQLGDALRATGDLQKALEQYGEALSLDPADEGARVGAALTLIGLDRSGEARDTLEEGLEIQPSSGLLAHTLSRLLAMGHDPEVRDGERALQLAQAVFAASQEVVYAEILAAALAELGRCDEAADWQQRVVGSTEENAGLASREEVLAIYSQGPPCRYPLGR